MYPIIYLVINDMTKKCETFIARNDFEQFSDC